ncbi:MAG: asparagine synthetase B, partial [Clostridia bacterium]|nr:asparagine synthetase B [Clostridia bacterium]
MCGIAGWLDKYTDLSEQKTVIRHMVSSLEKRGPDEEGIFFGKHNHICLMHRRLTVIDPEGGQQPMSVTIANETYTIVYNGELYNTDEIRKELLKQNYQFVSHSDTEVLLKAYICWKENCVEKLNGIFAFAVYEHNSRKLFTARDRIGVKPFFYYEYPDGFLFASEIKALLQCPKVRAVVDEDG